MQFGLWREVVWLFKPIAHLCGIYAQCLHLSSGRRDLRIFKDRHTARLIHFLNRFH